MFKSFLHRRPAPEASRAIADARDLMARGRLADAESALAPIVRRTDAPLEALLLAGELGFVQGRIADAESLLARAVDVDPGSTHARLWHGHALRAAGRYGDALTTLAAATAADASNAAAWSAHGEILLLLGRMAEAVPCFEAALSTAPNDVQAMANIGLALSRLGRHDDAVAVFDRALELRGDVAEIHLARANALYGAGRDDEALASYDALLRRWPEHAEAGTNRGNALHRCGRSAEAIAQYDAVLARTPAHVAAAFNRATVLRSLGRRAEAAAAFDYVLALNRDHVEALHGLGVLLQEMRLHADAAACFAHLVDVAPSYPHALGNLANARAQCCAWDERAALTSRIEDAVRAGEPACLPFIFMTLVDDPAAQLRCASSHMAARHPPTASPLWRDERYGHARLRIAYLSADFRDHAVAFLTAGLFEQHDRSRVEVIGISFGGGAGTLLRERIERACDRFFDVRGRTDAEIAQLIRELEVDVAVDLMGSTGESRSSILAHRPAAVQVNYLGYPGTMGAPYIDYLLADRVVVPEHEARHYAERIAYLPDSFQANDDRRVIADLAATRASVGLPDDAFVFCCFNAGYKITPMMFDAWMRVLRRVPGSVLWLIGGEPIVEHNLRREARERGADADRLVFLPRLPYADYLAHFALADLFLDTLPFNAGTTASDALWGGLPVLTVAGRSFAARMAASLLGAVGLPEFATTSLAEYEERAVQLAQDAGTLATARARLREQRMTLPLFSTHRFCRHLEAAYGVMCERVARGEPPETFAVAPLPTAAAPPEA